MNAQFIHFALTVVLGGCLHQVALFDAAAKDLRQTYARRSIEMIEVFARAKKKVRGTTYIYSLYDTTYGKYAP